MHKIIFSVEDFTLAKMWSISWVATSCRPVSNCQCFSGTYRLQCWWWRRWRQQVPPDYQLILTSLCRVNPKDHGLNKSLVLMLLWSFNCYHPRPA